MKHRHNKGNSTAPESASTTNGRALAATVGSASVIMDPVGVVMPAASADTELLGGEVGHEEIAKLAYTYWIARGHSHGSAEEDWLRAERELRQRR
jgi:hypothetical protein